MTDDTYNGWANRETWAVALWINNEQGWQESVHEALREAVGEIVVGDEGYEHADVPLLDWQAGDIVRENVEETLDMMLESDPDAYRSVRDDFGSMWRVDWQEIGRAFLADALEQDT